MEIISITSAFVDLEATEHHGVLICFPYKMPERNFDGYVFKLPYVAEGDYKKNFCFNSNGISNVGYYKEQVIITFVPEMQKKILVLDLGHGDDENSIEKCIYDNELQVFLKLCSKFLPIEPVKLKTSEDMFSFLKESTSSYSETDRQISVFFCYPPDFSYHPYIRSYVLFILENISLEEKESKNLIRSVKSVPAFMKSLSWNNEKAIYWALRRFIEIHVCDSRTCDSFTLRKCSFCGAARYCDEACQLEDWERHRWVCKDWKNMNDKEFYVGTVIEKHLEMATGKKPALTFEQFIREVNSRIFEACLESLQKNRFFLHSSSLDKVFKMEQKCPAKISNLLRKNRKGDSMFLFKSQLNESYGSDNFINQMMRGFKSQTFTTRYVKK